MTTYVLYCGVLITFEEYKRDYFKQLIITRALET